MAYEYSPSNKFGSKDILPPGAAAKKIKGSDFDVEFNAIASAIGTTKNLFAAVTYGGSAALAGTNVASVRWLGQRVDGQPSWKFAYVSFLTGLDGTDNPNKFPTEDDADPINGVIDANLNIQVTPFSNASNSLNFAGFAFATITEIANYHCEIAFTQIDQNLQFQAVWDIGFCLMISEN